MNHIQHTNQLLTGQTAEHDRQMTERENQQQTNICHKQPCNGFWMGGVWVCNDCQTEVKK